MAFPSVEAGGGRVAGPPARGRNIDDLCFHALGAQLWPESLGYLQQAARQAVERAANQAALSSGSKLKFSGFVQGRYEWHQDAGGQKGDGRRPPSSACPRPGIH